MARLHHWCFDLKKGDDLESHRFNHKEDAENKARIWLSKQLQDERSVLKDDPVMTDMLRALSEAVECLWSLEEGDFRRAVTLWNHYASRAIGLPEVFVRRCHAGAESP